MISLFSKKFHPSDIGKSEILSSFFMPLLKSFDLKVGKDIFFKSSPQVKLGTRKSLRGKFHTLTTFKIKLYVAVNNS